MDRHPRTHGYSPTATAAHLSTSLTCDAEVYEQARSPMRQMNAVLLIGLDVVGL
jgi:hypothetical protein